MMVARKRRSRALAAGALLVMAAIFATAGCGGGGGGGSGNTDGVANWQLRVTDLGTLGGDAGQALAVNEAGQVVGWSRLPGTNTHHAFLWDNGNMTALAGPRPADDSRATGINSSGVVCGTTGIGTDHESAFRYMNGAFQTLGGLPGMTTSAASGINDDGQIVGHSASTMFMYANGQMNPMPTPGGDGAAEAVNRSGQVAGWYQVTGGTAMHALRGTLTRAIDLHTNRSDSSQAFDINDSGHVVGVYVRGTERRAFVYRGGSMRDIGTLGGTQAQAHGINNSDLVVGFDFAVTPGGHAVHAFAWDGAMHDLNDLLDQNSQGWTLARAFAISDNNLIVGHGRNPIGQYRPFLARPN